MKIRIHKLTNGKVIQEHRPDQGYSDKNVPVIAGAIVLASVVVEAIDIAGVPVEALDIVDGLVVVNRELKLPPEPMSAKAQAKQVLGGLEEDDRLPPVVKDYLVAIKALIC